MLRYLTAGESHGKALVGIIEGIPSGLSLSSDDIDRDLRRRQQGYGRGGRMKIEHDHAEILSGVRWGKAIGSPIALLIKNRDWENWQEGMSDESAHEGSIPAVTRPRPGHADLSGALKYDHKDIRNILERSSARETAMRVALGGIAKKFLSEFKISVYSYVLQVGTIRSQRPADAPYHELFTKAERSPLRCPDPLVSDEMKSLIDTASKNGDTLGGVFEVAIVGVPAGIGSHIQWDTRLDGRLSQAISSIQAIKGVEIGTGFGAAEKFGSEVMDEIFYEPAANFYRKTNNAGGIEGGMTNGMPILIRAAMKPIPTLKRPLHSVDIVTKEHGDAVYERSDVCAVPAASVVAEAMAALVIANALLEKFGGDSIAEAKSNFDRYMAYLSTF